MEGKGTGVAMAHLRVFILVGGFTLSRGVITCDGLVLVVHVKCWYRGQVGT